MTLFHNLSQTILVPQIRYLAWLWRWSCHCFSDLAAVFIVVLIVLGPSRAPSHGPNTGLSPSSKHPTPPRSPACRSRRFPGPSVINKRNPQTDPHQEPACCVGKAENLKKDDPSKPTSAKRMRQVQQMQQLVYAAAGFPVSGPLQSFPGTETVFRD